MVTLGDGSESLDFCRMVQMVGGVPAVVYPINRSANHIVQKCAAVGIFRDGIG